MGIPQEKRPTTLEDGMEAFYLEAHAISLDDGLTIELTLEHKQARPAQATESRASSGGDSDGDGRI
jgi:hypothetical protein